MLIWSSAAGGAVRAERGIVRAHEYDTVGQLHEILGLAAQEAQAIRQRAEQAADERLLQAQAQAEGLLEQARAQAQACQQQAQQAAAQALAQAQEEGHLAAAQQWHQRWAELQAGHHAALAGRAEQLAGIVVQAVERMVCAGPREALFARALQALRDALGEATGARWQVHPDDLAAARAALAADEQGQVQPLRLQIEADAGLAPGACVFDSSLGRLDASLAVQLAGLRAALAQATRLAMADPEAQAALQAPGEAFDEAGPEAAQPAPHFMQEDTAHG